MIRANPAPSWPSGPLWVRVGSSLLALFLGGFESIPQSGILSHPRKGAQTGRCAALRSTPFAKSAPYLHGHPGHPGSPPWFERLARTYPLQERLAHLYTKVNKASRKNYRRSYQHLKHLLHTKKGINSVSLLYDSSCFIF